MDTAALLPKVGLNPRSFKTLGASVLLTPGQDFALLGDVVRTGTPRLSLDATSRLDGRGKTLTFDYSDSSNNANLVAGKLSNLNIVVTDGHEIERLLHESGHGPALWEHLKVTYTSATTPYPIGDDNDDAALLIYEDYGVLSDIRIEGFSRALRIYSDNVTMTDGYFSGYVQGLILDNSDGFTGYNLNFSTPSSLATTDPGYNAITGSGTNTRLYGGSIVGSGEHGIYLTSATVRVTGFFISGYDISQLGQSAIKLRNYDRVVIEDVTAADCSYGNSTGTNEDGLHLEHCGDVVVSNFRLRKRTQPDSAYYGMYLQGVQGLKGSDIDLRDTAAGGLYLTPSVLGSGFALENRPVQDVVIKGLTTRNLGGPAIIIDHAAQEIGDVCITGIDIDGCPGAPVSITVGTITTGKKIILKGTYRNCGAGMPYFSAYPQIDVSGLVPADLNDNRGLATFGILNAATRKWLSLDSTEPSAGQAATIAKHLDRVASKGIVLNRFALFATKGANRRNYDFIGGTWSVDLSPAPTDNVGIVSGAAVETVSSLFSTAAGTFGVCVEDDIGEDHYAVSHTSATGSNNRFRFNPRNAAGNLSMRLGGSSDLTVASTNSKATWIATWDVDDAIVYKDGVSFFATAHASLLMPVAALSIGRFAADYSTRRHSIFFASASRLTAPQVTYMQAVCADIRDGIGLV